MKTEAAQCAALIRKDLKTAFPLITFTVRSSNFSMGDSVDIGYKDGVPCKDVEAIVNKYQYGHFNGMEDIYETSDRVKGLPQAKFVMVQRDISPEVKEMVKNEIMKKFGMTEWTDAACREKFNCWSDQVLWREISDRSFMPAKAIPATMYHIFDRVIA